VLERRERAAAGPQLPPVLRRDVRFGAAVCGTFLAARGNGVLAVLLLVAERGVH
jgi:hypothetical protein